MVKRFHKIPKPAEPKPTGEKHDAGKPRYDLMPVDAERMVVEVLTYGAKKYAPDNWRHVENASSRYYSAARRHMEAWRSGELSDSETDCHHLAHAICCLMFQLQLDIESVREVGRFIPFQRNRKKESD